MYSNDSALFVVGILKQIGPCSLRRLELLTFTCEWLLYLRYEKLLSDFKWYNTPSGPVSVDFRDMIVDYSNHFYINEKIISDSLTPEDAIAKYHISVSELSAILPTGLDTKSDELVTDIVQRTKKFDSLALLQNVRGLYPSLVTDGFEVVDWKKCRRTFIEEKDREHGE